MINSLLLQYHNIMCEYVITMYNCLVCRLAILYRQVGASTRLIELTHSELTKQLDAAQCKATRGYTPVLLLINEINNRHVPTVFPR